MPPDDNAMKLPVECLAPRAKHKAKGRATVARSSSPMLAGMRSVIPLPGLAYCAMNDSAQETFSYGGCFDLGSVISHSIQADVPRSRESVLQMAAAHSEKFWRREFIGSAHAATALASAIANIDFTVERFTDGEIYHVNNPAFVQLYVEHHFRNGADTITVVYQDLV